MAKYLTKFTDRSDYNMYKYGKQPSVNVSYIEAEDKVEYDKHTVETTPFTITCIHDNSQVTYLNFRTWRAQTSADAKKLYFKYSIDDGVTWTTLLTGNQLANEYENKEVYTGIGLLEGDSVQIIANTGGCMIYDLFFDTNDQDREFKLSGNVLSLYSGDAYMSGSTDTEEIYSSVVTAYSETYDVPPISSFRLNAITPGGTDTVYDVSDLWLPTYQLRPFMYHRAFYDSSIKNVPSAQFNVSSLPYSCFNYTFSDCMDITDASLFKIKFMTPVVEYSGFAMSGMFYNCGSLETGATIDTDNLQEITFVRQQENSSYAGDKDNNIMRDLYSACYVLTDTGIDIPKVNIVGYTNAAFIGTFSGCHNITSFGIDEICRLNCFEASKIRYCDDPTNAETYNLMDYAFNDCISVESTPHITGVYTHNLDDGLNYTFHDLQSCNAIYWYANRMRTADQMTAGLQNHDGTWYVNMQLQFNPLDYRQNDNGIPENWDIKIKAGNYHIYGGGAFVDWPGEIYIDGVMYNRFLYNQQPTDKYFGNGLGMYWHMILDELKINDTTYTNITWTYKEDDGEGRPIYESNITFNSYPVYGVYNQDVQTVDLFLQCDNLDPKPTIYIDLDYTYTLASDVVIFDHNT